MVRVEVLEEFYLEIDIKNFMGNTETNLVFKSTRRCNA